MAHPKLPAFDGYLPRDDWSPPEDPATRAFRRQIVAWMELHAGCRREACRRAGACRSRSVACFEEHRPIIVDGVFDFLLDGYRCDDEDDE